MDHAGRQGITGALTPLFRSISVQFHHIQSLVSVRSSQNSMSGDFATSSTGPDEGPNVEASPGTRRRRRQPSRTHQPDISSLNMPTLNHPTSFTKYENFTTVTGASTTSLPVHHAASIDSPRFKGHRGSPPSRWMRTLSKPVTIVRILGLVVIARLVYTHYFFLVASHQRSLWNATTSPATNRFLDVLLPHSNHHGALDHHTSIIHTQPVCPNWLSRRRQERIYKTRPQSVVPNHGVSNAGVFLDLRPHLDVPTDDPPNWKELCQQANMNSGSQILIFNLLSHPVGPAVAKLVAKQCHVKKIVGADPMLPNLRHVRMDFMNIRKELEYHIHELETTVTEPGMGLHEKNRLRPLQWLGDVEPTHVLILDPMDSPVLVNSLGGLPSFELYAIQQLRHVWQDLTVTMKQLPMRVLHVGTSLLHRVSVAMGRASVSQWDSRIPFSFASLRLDSLSGPGITTNRYVASNTTTTFVEQGLRAVLTGWTRPQQMFSVSLNPPPVTGEEALETSIWEDHVKHPFGLTSPSSNETAIVNARHRLESLGSVPVKLLCASQCQATSSLRTCTASVWDHAIAPSVNATQGCKYALVMANFSSHVESAPLHQIDKQMCRVLYISRKSALAKKFKTKSNGEAVSNGWKLVWLDVTEKSYSANDAAFLRIDPSRLLSSSVVKVMHINTMTFGTAPDNAMLNIMQKIDRPAVRDGERRVLEHRRGTELQHWKTLPAEKARRAVMFIGNPLPESQPAKVADYRSMAGGSVPKKQLEHYTQLGHWTHVILDRPQDEIDTTRYLTFPFEWTSRYFIIHDVASEAARQLRCRWMQEHLTWNTKPAYWETDDLSLAYVLGSMKILNEIGLPLDEVEKGWLPFLNQDEETLVEDNEQIFLRLMQPRDE